MHRARLLASAALALASLGCKAPAPGQASRDASATSASPPTSGALAAASAISSASASAARASPALDRPVGPYELPFDGARRVYYVLPRHRGPARLLANLHGVCNPPGYACGYWTEASSHAGLLVCPEGNARCGRDGPPTWTEPFAAMDADLERAIAAVDAQHPGELTREGAVLTGFSLGAYAAVQIALSHPGRWPYLVLNEANVALDAGQLRRAGVRAVALIAGENGAQLAGERRTAERLAKHGFPARLWVMKGAGHHYSADIDAIMAEALAFVLAAGGGAAAAAFTSDAADAGAAR